MKKGLTEIVVILDRSGSMSSRVDDTIGGFNTFVETQQGLVGAGEARLSLIQFDHLYEPNYEGKEIGQVEKLTNVSYSPRGSTALFDAIGRTISVLGARLNALTEDEKPEKVMVLIISDGYENASQEFTQGMVKALIEHQSLVYKWMISFLGTNQDAVLTGQGLGVERNKSMSYGTGTIGTHAVFGAMGQSVTRGRTSESVAAAFMSSDYTDQERAETIMEDDQVDPEVLKQIKAQQGQKAK